MAPSEESGVPSRPNMSAIAREAGVGKATVSLALRNDPRLRPETCRKIQAVAERMGYRANAVVSNLMAQLRASRNPNFQATIALLNASRTQSDLQTNFTFRAWVAGIHRRATTLGYAVDEFWLYEPELSPKRLRQTLRARNIRGAVIAGVLEHGEMPSELDDLWAELACTVVGVRPMNPPTHFACNDQYSTALEAALRLVELGYTSFGLVIDPLIEKNIDYRFSAGFAAGLRLASIKQDFPMLDFHASERSEFAKWFRHHRPQVIVCTHPEIRTWLEGMGLRIPADVGLIHLDVTPEVKDWSGMDQNNEVVGSFAVDLVIGQLHRNELGIPAQPKCMMIESQWISGKTVRRIRKLRKIRTLQPGA